MYTSFHLKANELDEDFLKKLKVMFKSKNISITVEEDEDETEKLIAQPENLKMLRTSILQAERGELVKIKMGKTHKK